MQKKNIKSNNTISMNKIIKKLKTIQFFLKSDSKYFFSYSKLSLTQLHQC